MGFLILPNYRQSSNVKHFPQPKRDYRAPVPESKNVQQPTLTTFFRTLETEAICFRLDPNWVFPGKIENVSY